MSDGRRVLALIPARGGSKGVPRKNVRTVAGKPLIAWTIDQARGSKHVSDVVVSTDDDEIARISEQCGAEVVRRPEALARDGSLVIDAIRFTLGALEENGRRYDYFVLLEPTSPLRPPGLIDECIALIDARQGDSLATFSESIPPTRLWKFRDGLPVPYLEGSNPWLPRQQQAQAFELNGLVYAVRVEALKKEPASPSLLVGQMIGHVLQGRFVDIDTEADLTLASHLLKAEK